MKRGIVAACLFAGCASGRTAIEPIDAADNPGVDAKVFLDAPIQTQDAPPHPDAPPPPDAAPPDAYQCVVMTRNLLTNPALDLNPSGMGWVQQNIDNAYPIVTGDDGIPEHSAPFKAWMGGIVGGGTATDVLYQDVAVPANTTQLRFTGYYEVRTGETGSTVYDTGQVGITQTNGTPIETIRTFSNAAPTTAWTAFSYNVAANLSSQTVRLRFTTSNDFSNATSFYFDTLALTATYCQ
jgi:hypothetical protein